MTEAIKVKITALGAQGDGVAEHDGKLVFVPNALPGETWAFNHETGDYHVITEVVDRQKPICAHFSECGGCTAQHMSAALYENWKVEGLVRAFAHRGLEIFPEPLVRLSVGARRRTSFSFVRRGDGLHFGYHKTSTHHVVDIDDCPVLTTRISTMIPAFKAMLSEIELKPAMTGRADVTEVDDGLDVKLGIDDFALTPDARQILSRYAIDIGIRRLIVNQEPVIESGSQVLTINGAKIAITPEVFLQASSQADAELVSLVVPFLRRAKRIVDLFCGVGTFTFPLARKQRVTAFDSDKGAIESLGDAINRNQGFKPITVQRRDLFRDPLSPRELRDFDGVVINPPRAGAEQQCARLAKSKIPHIAMVACNPATLARDARLLIDGGYMLKSITPVDQFVYTSHLEAVALFQR